MHDYGIHLILLLYDNITDVDNKNKTKEILFQFNEVIKKKHINKTCVTNRIQHVVLLDNKNEHVCVDVKSKMDMYVLM